MQFIPLSSSSKGNAYLAQSEGAPPLLIECGVPLKHLREILSFSLSDLAGCLISHAHGDHSKAAKDLLKFGVDVYTSVETAEVLGIEDHYRVEYLTSGVQQQVAGWTVLAFDLHHDVETQGFFVDAPDGEKLLFVPDTSYIRNKFNGINILAIEANYISDVLSDNVQKGYLPTAVGHRTRRNHMSLETAIKMLKANDLSRCRQIWLLHLSSGNSDEELMIRRVREATGIPVYAAKE